MKITNHWLSSSAAGESIRIDPSPNSREIIDPDYLIVHYTATDDAAGPVNWFKNTSSNKDGIAAHIVIDMTGQITQLVPFNRRANHAGSSTWNGTDNMNFHAIGIELVNPGFVQALSNGTYRRLISPNNYKVYPATVVTRLLAMRHKNKLTGTDANASYWFKYPKAQLEALYSLSKVLADHYQLVQVLGHDDIAPVRKTDPGPAFSWEAFKTAVFGHSNNVGSIFTINASDFANFRTEPSTNSVVIKKLARGYEVGLIETVGLWCKVYLAVQRAEMLEGSRCIKKIGWVHSSLLQLKPLVKQPRTQRTISKKRK